MNTPNEVALEVTGRSPEPAGRAAGPDGCALFCLRFILSPE
ncbi:hypothetical protein [Streptomyces hyaluromycini]|nr:hypothetical protein [Streptomyces hyaluromycini]